GTTDQVLERIEFGEVNKAFLKFNMSAPSKQPKNVEAFHNALGDGWKNHPVLTPAERNSLVTGINGAIAKSERPKIMAEWGALDKTLKEAQASLRRAKT